MRAAPASQGGDTERPSDLKRSVGRADERISGSRRHTSRAMAPTYSFPILGNHEIIACLGELDIPLTEQDLLKPHSDTLYRAYEEIVCLLCGQTREGMYAPNLEAAMDVLEFPELYEDAIGNLKFHRHLFELMSCCGVPDFNLKDLIKPEYARTRRNISAVINFAKYREEKVAAFEEAQEEEEAAEARHAEALRRNAELKAQIQRIQEARQAEQSDIEAVEAEVEEWSAKHAEVKKIHDEEMAKKKVAEESLAEAQAHEAAVEAKLTAARDEIASLEAQLVKSPEKAANELKELERATEEESAALEEQERKARTAENKVTWMKDLADEMKKLVEYMEEVEEERRTTEEAEVKVREVKSTLAETEEEQYQMQAKIETLKRQEGNMNEKMARLRKQGELKIHAAEASLKAAKEELSAVQARRAADDAKSAEESQQVAHLQREIQRVKDVHKAEIEALLRNFGSLRDQVSEYHAGLADAMHIEEAQRVPLSRLDSNGGMIHGNNGVNGDFTGTYNWTNYDTMSFGKHKEAAQQQQRRQHQQQQQAVVPET